MFVIGVAAPQGRIMYCLQALIYVTHTLEVCAPGLQAVEAEPVQMDEPRLNVYNNSIFRHAALQADGRPQGRQHDLRIICYDQQIR